MGTALVGTVLETLSDPSDSSDPGAPDPATPLTPPDPATPVTPPRPPRSLRPPLTRSLRPSRTRPPPRSSRSCCPPRPGSAARPSNGSSSARLSPWCRVPAGWPASCAGSSSAPGWPARACPWMSGTAMMSRRRSGTRSSCGTSSASGQAAATSPPPPARCTTCGTRAAAASPAWRTASCCAGYHDHVVIHRMGEGTLVARLESKETAAVCLRASQVTCRRLLRYDDASTATTPAGFRSGRGSRRSAGLGPRPVRRPWSRGAQAR
jgi:hypothetical protein